MQTHSDRAQLHLWSSVWRVVQGHSACLWLLFSFIWPLYSPKLIHGYAMVEQTELKGWFCYLHWLLHIHLTALSYFWHLQTFRPSRTYGPIWNEGICILCVCGGVTRCYTHPQRSLWRWIIELWWKLIALEFLKPENPAEYLGEKF